MAVKDYSSLTCKCEEVAKCERREKRENWEAIQPRVNKQRPPFLHNFSMFPVAVKIDILILVHFSIAQTTTRHRSRSVVKTSFSDLPGGLDYESYNSLLQDLHNQIVFDVLRVLLGTRKWITETGLEYFGPIIVKFVFREFSPGTSIDCV